MAGKLAGSEGFIDHEQSMAMHKAKVANILQVREKRDAQILGDLSMSQAVAKQEEVKEIIREGE